MQIATMNTAPPGPSSSTPRDALRGPSVLRFQAGTAKKGRRSFFGIPNYARARLEGGPPDRLDLGVLGGRRTLVVNGFEPERFFGNVVYAETSAERVAALDPQAPLRGLDRNASTEPLFRQHWHPTLDLRAAPDCQTNLPPTSIARIVVYEAQRIDPDLLSAEIMRVAMPGAKVTIAGVGPVYVEEAFDTEFNQLLKTLAPIRTAGEKSVWCGFKDMLLDLNERASLVTMAGVKNQYVPAQWTFSQLERFLRSYPVIERAQQQVARDGVTTPHLLAADLNDMFARLKQAWGAPSKARPINWPVRILTGYVR